MIGRLVDGRYQVRSRIARGGMATVYLATDLRLERRVAIKIMHGHLADDNTFKTRFVQEARSAARLAHPNVVNVFDQGQDDDMAYLVMEYLPGITLRDLLKDYKRLTAVQTVDILDAVLAGLAAAHRAGIVHRDVKPENVLLADDGRIKLSDFGLARAASQNTATGQALLGTIAYLSPELVTRGVADARSDVYALGIMLYEMLTGEQPFVGEAPMQIAYQHANDQVPAPSSRVPSVPRALDELVEWATRRDPEERPANAGELLERLREIESELRGGASGAQPTLVLGDLSPAAAATAETTVLGPRRVNRTAAVALIADEDDVPEPVARLRNDAQRRRARGWWLFALVLLIAGAAGGTGWYFGAGPGAFSAVENVTGVAPDEAQQTLEAQGFVVDRGEESSIDVPDGAVSSTDPPAGTNLKKGAKVTLLVSTGPQLIAVPDVAGAAVDDAKAQLTSFALGADDERISYEAAAGTVMAVLDGDGNPIEAGTEYPEQGAMTLVVSLGPIPDVAGQSEEQAKQTLADFGFSDVNVNAEGKYDDTGAVPAGAALRAGSDEEIIRKDTPIWITLSLGIQMVEVPNVITGQTVAAARDQLEALGLVVTSNVPDLFVGVIIPTTQSPAAGESVQIGSTVEVNYVP
nr:Stk1 family PASTA domain-containing Ser/Thr kinase [Agromyces seonyuensis]